MSDFVNTTSAWKLADLRHCFNSLVYAVSNDEEEP
jgi:hypothetical protein